MSKLFTELNHMQRVKLLYKTILKLHRGLPTELKVLGDNYVKDEFRRHKTCSPMEANFFMTEWSKYAVSLSQQLGIRGKPKGKLGAQLEENDLNNFRADQIVQLYELSKAATSNESVEKQK